MRPRTVVEACARATTYETLTRPIGEFLDEYYGAESAAERVAMLSEEPALFGDDRLNALVAGMAEYLYKRWTPGAPPPAWIGNPERYLRAPWFPGVSEPGVQEYLTWCSPPEFKSRNIMTDAQPFRRALQRGRHTV